MADDALTQTTTQLAHHGLPCPSCGAQPGEWCRTFRSITRPVGQRAGWLHTARTRLLDDAWRIGWRDGHRSEGDSIAAALEAASKGHHWAVRDRVPQLDADTVARLVAWLEARGA